MSAEQSKVADLGFPDLVSGLKATPGCLGVETARTASGKEVILARFTGLCWRSGGIHPHATEGETG